jgi:hypothetical protein
MEALSLNLRGGNEEGKKHFQDRLFPARGSKQAFDEFDELPFGSTCSVTLIKHLDRHERIYGSNTALLALKKVSIIAEPSYISSKMCL